MAIDWLEQVHPAPRPDPEAIFHFLQEMKLQPTIEGRHIIIDLNMEEAHAA